MTPWWRSAVATVLRVGLYLLPVLALVGLVAVALGVEWAWRRHAASETQLPLVTGTTLFFLCAAVVVTWLRQDRIDARRATTGVPVEASAHPALWHAVEEACRAAGVTVPSRVYLGLDPTRLAVTERTTRRAPYHLVVGVAPLCVLSPAEWQAALVQCLATEEAGPRRDRRLLRAHRRLVALFAPPPPKEPLMRRVGAWVRLHERLAAPTCRARQFRADLLSAQLTSVGDARAAMLLPAAATLTWEEFWALHVASGFPLLRRPMGIVAGYREYLAAVGLVAPPAADPPEVDVTAALPAVMTRLAALAGHGGAHGTPDATSRPNPAVALLTEEQPLVQWELLWFRDTGLTPADWEDLAPATATRIVRQRAAWFLEQVSTPSRRANLSTVLADLSEHAGQQVPAPVPGESEPVWDPHAEWVEDAELIGDLIATAVVEAGAGQFVHSWGVLATLVGSDGVELDPWLSALMASVDPEQSAGLRRWCADVGLPPDFRALPPGADLGRTRMDADPVPLLSGLLCSSMRFRFVFVLDTGVVVRRPNVAEFFLYGFLFFGGDTGPLLQAHLGTPGRELMTAPRSHYTDWSEVRSVLLRQRSVGCLHLTIERADGSTFKQTIDATSHLTGDLAGTLQHLLGDRFVNHARKYDEFMRLLHRNGRA